MFHVKHLFKLKFGFYIINLKFQTSNIKSNYENQRPFSFKEEFEIRETEIEGIFKTYPIPENLGKYYESKDYISHHQDSNSLKEKYTNLLNLLILTIKRNILSKVI